MGSPSQFKVVSSGEKSREDVPTYPLGNFRPVYSFPTDLLSGNCVTGQRASECRQKSLNGSVGELSGFWF